MDIINIASYIGKDIRTRSFFRHDIEELIKNKESVTLDFSEVTFISRSVADELYNVLEDYPDIQVCNRHKPHRAAQESHSTLDVAHTGCCLEEN